MKFLGKSKKAILIDTGIVDLETGEFVKCNPGSVAAHSPYFFEDMPTEEEKKKVKEIMGKNEPVKKKSVKFIFYDNYFSYPAL